MSELTALPGETVSASLLPNTAGVVASGTVTFAGIDLRDYIGTIALLLTTSSTTATGNTGVQMSLLDSADNSTFATFAGAPTFSLITAATELQKIILDTRACRRYVQPKHVITGTTATFAMAIVASGIKQVV